MNAYLIGLPGAGKTALMRSITAGLLTVEATKPFAHKLFLDNEGSVTGIELGAGHETFAGTDRLSMSVQPAAIGFVQSMGRIAPQVTLVGEGDRLATAAFLDALGGDLVWLDTPSALAAERRAGRGGKAQSAKWVVGRATKIANLIGSRPHIRLDGTLPPVELRRAAEAAVPAFAELAAQRPQVVL